MKQEIWVSRETGKEAILEYIKGNHHWYSIPEFNRPQPCRSDVFLAAMVKKETLK